MATRVSNRGSRPRLRYGAQEVVVGRGRAELGRVGRAPPLQVLLRRHHGVAAAESGEGGERGRGGAGYRGRDGWAAPASSAVEREGGERGNG